MDAQYWILDNVQSCISSFHCVSRSSHESTWSTFSLWWKKKWTHMGRRWRCVQLIEYIESGCCRCLRYCLSSVVNESAAFYIPEERVTEKCSSVLWRIHKSRTMTTMREIARSLYISRVYTFVCATIKFGDEKWNSTVPANVTCHPSSIYILVLCNTILCLICSVH